MTGGFSAVQRRAPKNVGTPYHDMVLKKAEVELRVPQIELCKSYTAHDSYYFYNNAGKAGGSAEDDGRITVSSRVKEII